MASKSPKRRYRLTPQGFTRLQGSIQRVQPWLCSTGPRTPEGKARSRMNAWKHGERSAEEIARQRELASLLREVRAYIAEEYAELRRVKQQIRSLARPPSP